MPGEEHMPLAKRAILCVQPNIDCHPALKLALSKHRLVIVPNALEAIRATNATAFDAYVLDYWLPDWAGVSLCREFRKMDPHGPICFFSAAYSDEQRKRAKRAGANAFLHAPDGALALSDKLRTLLQHADSSSMRARLEEEQAVQEELERRAAIAMVGTEHARQRAAEAIERAARVRAQKAFIEAGGTLASFQRWWPQMVASVMANHRAASIAPPPRGEVSIP